MTVVSKQTIIDILEELALRGELNGENPFKIRAFHNAARVLSTLDQDINEAFLQKKLHALPGIGAGILAIIEQALHHQPITELVKLRACVPDGVLELTHIEGLGPKRARLLWQELDIKNLGELDYALKENRLQTLRGFGKKIEQAILSSLIAYRKNQHFFRLDQLLDSFTAWQQIACDTDPLSTIYLAGECARAHESSRRLTMAWYSSQTFAALSHALKDFTQSVAAPNCLEISLDSIPCTINVLHSLSSLGANLVWLTSDADFQTALVEHAQKKHLTFNQHGLFKESALLNTPSEEDFFKALELPFIDRERREGSTLPKKKILPRLIELKDLRGAFHNHTVASDGIHTLEEMRDAAIALGLSYISINDHSHSAAYAHGLDDTHLKEQLLLINKLNQDHKSAHCWIFSGTESDILFDGALDFSDRILSELDIVIASVHSRLKQDRDTMTKRMLNAVANPYTTIIGHPTGRLILDRAASNFAMEELMHAALTHKKILELNANPHRLDLGYEHLVLAKEAGVMIAINPDAHSVNGLKDLEYGILVARRAGITPDDVLNCLSLDDMKKWLSARKKKLAL